MKKCYVCSLEKNLIEFVNKKNSKDGKGNICLTCRKEYDKNYREKNKEKIKEREKLRNRTEYNKKYGKEYREKNLNKLREKEKIRSHDNKERKKDYSKKYYQKNKEKIKEKIKTYNSINREKINSHKQYRYKTDILFKITHIISSGIRKALKGRKYTKKSKTYKIVGCSLDFLKGYLEAKFLDWMNWENHGLYNGKYNFGWDIDHIIPIDSAKTEEDLYKLLHYTNLQPLCSKINRDEKKNNY